MTVNLNQKIRTSRRSELVFGCMRRRDVGGVTLRWPWTLRYLGADRGWGSHRRSRCAAYIPVADANENRR